MEMRSVIKKSMSLMVVMLVSAFVSCNSDDKIIGNEEGKEETDIIKNDPSKTCVTGEVKNISYTWTDMFGWINVSDDLMSEVEFGIEWSEDSEFSMQGNIERLKSEVVDGENKYKVGAYTDISWIDEGEKTNRECGLLKPGTEYYYRAYVKYSNGVIKYGDVRSFKTKDWPDKVVETGDMDAKTGMVMWNSVIIDEKGARYGIQYGSDEKFLADSKKVYAPWVIENNFIVELPVKVGRLYYRAYMAIPDFDIQSYERFYYGETRYVDVDEVFVADKVDLGLSVLWASCNVGANSYSDYGGFFAWAETATKNNYEIGEYYKYGKGTSRYTKYCLDEKYGYGGLVDKKKVLDLEDDAARVNWGGDWRMPTVGEMEELLDRNKCKWEWTTKGGRSGYLVTSKVAGYEGNSIFLPAAGGYNGGTWSSKGSYGSYWSKTLVEGNTAWCLFFGSSQTYMNDSSRGGGNSVRPVCQPSDYISVSGVSLDKSDIDIIVGHDAVLNVDVAPSNASNKKVSWYSDDTDVVLVDDNGKLTALKVGTAIVYAYSDNGGERDSCVVEVIPIAGNECVDLGLSVKWSVCNVGAESPEGYGYYFAWGEIEEKSCYDLSTYKYCKGEEDTMTKYCTMSYYGYNGFTDNIEVLDLSDDAARAVWGGKWRMPTDDEWSELCNEENCEWLWTTQKGVKGYKVTSKKFGYTDQSIFLPAGGYRFGVNSSGIGKEGNYWSSSVFENCPSCGFNLSFDSVHRDIYCGSRDYGMTIRPVRP